MTSSATSVRDALAEYHAGRLSAQQLVALVAPAYYRGERGKDALRQVMEVFERAHPGVVELSSAPEQPGFLIKLAERPFPRTYEPELREAVFVALTVLSPNSHKRINDPAAAARPPATKSLWARVLHAIRRIFSA